MTNSKRSYSRNYFVESMVFCPEHTKDSDLIDVIECRACGVPKAPDNTAKCGQPDRDRETIRKFAEKYAVMALANLPNDYESRKRIITNAIFAAFTSHEE